MDPQSSESGSPSFDSQSPYAPPVSTGSVYRTGFTATEYAAPFPFRLTFFSTCLATAALGVMFIIDVGSDTGGILTFALPFISVSIFVYVCMNHFLAGGAEARTAAWKTLMITLIPVASVLLFVPTCVGTGFAMFIVMDGMRSYGGGGSPIFMMIPFFAGYLATFSVIALRLRYRMPKAAAENSTNWNTVQPSSASFTVPSAQPSLKAPTELGDREQS